MADHWADQYAERVVREKGDKSVYVCASGITPSGTVHIGNFREIISVDLVVRALRRLGKTVRFIYSWDDFDVFRKVPANMPDQDRLATFLRQPITRVPDPFGKEASYARANEKNLEEVLGRVGVHPEYIYQAEMYEESRYAEGIRTALEHTDAIRRVLDDHRDKPLPPSWLPVSVFCSSCFRDTTTVSAWDGDWGLSYSCDSCGHGETVDLRKSRGAKLPWRVDWPMRWAYEKVDFEPAGKEHHSAGGSFDTAKRIVREVYAYDPPVTFKYDFITVKGTGGKISSSQGNVISLEDVLSVYQPEVVRYMFAGTRPDTEFAISFDLDVIKIYEDYDRCERVFFGLEEIGEKRRQKERRSYELSQVDDTPREYPDPTAYRHLCNLLQIQGGDVVATLRAAAPASDAAADALRRRAQCAWTWISEHAPEDFRFALRAPAGAPVEVDGPGRAALAALREAIAGGIEELDEKSLGERIYAIAEDQGIKPRDLFTLVYNVLLGKDRGPRLASFILTAGAERILPLLEGY